MALIAESVPEKNLARSITKVLSNRYVAQRLMLRDPARLIYRASAGTTGTCV